MIKWTFFPSNKKNTSLLNDVVIIFENRETIISSESHDLKSNEVLKVVEPDLELLGFKVEKDKQTENKIKVPVLFGERGKVKLGFDADAYNESGRTIIEVEAGRAVANYQFLKDLFQASMMYNVEYLCICVRKDYRGNDDYKKVCDFITAMYSSNRLILPLEGILIIGY